ncbi:MAG: hypothetical protein ABIL37_02100 [candidate division WOR-3 bacterium]
MNRTFLKFLVFSLFVVNKILAQEDVKGSKDHPIVSRYPGSYIYYYDQKEFGEFEILLGPVKSSIFKLQKKKESKGKLQRFSIKHQKIEVLLKFLRTTKRQLRKQILIFCIQPGGVKLLE